MAKRRRLTPAQAGFGAEPDPQPGAGPAQAAPGAAAPAPGQGGPLSPLRPPIAQVAGAAATEAALSEMTGILARAEAEGRMIRALPLEQIEAEHLMRDRLGVEPEAFEALKQSLRARGQQTPIEVMALPGGQGPRYGLISGWRRLLALRQLAAETGEARFAQVLALLRQPQDLAASYVAMVEENEIRADLSHYERARVVLRALEAGVFETEKQALQTLFASASYARRSKIKSFLPVVQALDGALCHPAALTERLGLALSKALEAEGQAEALRADLEARPPRDAEDEAARLQAFLGARRGPAQPAAALARTPPPVRMEARAGHVVLSGEAVDRGFIADLSAWLRARGR